MKRRRVLVTGATGSIGRAIVEQLAGDYQLIVHGHRRKAVLNEFRAGFDAEIWLADFSVPDFPLPPADVDAVVNVAGINVSSGLVHEVSLDDLMLTMQVNLTAPFRVLQHVLPHMIDQRWGRIVNVGSIYSLRGSSNNSPYNMSKHGLSGLTKSLARDYGSVGISTNEVCPGAVESEMMTRIAQEKAASGVTTESGYLDAVAKGSPRERMATPHDVAATVEFLLSDASCHMNGCSIPVDGGQIA